MARRISTGRLGQPLDSLGEFIAAQRRQAGVSLRQLAESAGVSNPYLSQIERGLRRPSAEVLQQLAKALQVSAETLYVRAGLLDPQEQPAPAADGVSTVPAAVLADRLLTGRQKQIILDVYDSFVDAARSRAASTPAAATPPAAGTATATSTTTTTTEQE
ncbi:helix-turn-helix domain-containing protein [Auraticoccus sp. F435]|uniref:Helix-turn-helix domain-containing protein n=1 Tax=Auraticoccus cholistanensis TaxID=2656650 RepID=A0A6A9V2D0_9ACTN|nr:helix-turn-helix transcriptional regulator [Auraticoccus cholistanensis]MVA77724.1 helix-turn-helix domain-containing protein [Auraticoccus cholistanensis]